MAAAQVARRSGRAVLAAVLRRLGRGCFLPAFSLLPQLQSNVARAQLQIWRLTRLIPYLTSYLY